MGPETSYAKKAILPRKRFRCTKDIVSFWEAVGEGLTPRQNALPSPTTTTVLCHCRH